jgi:hypothetical protein
MLRLFRFKLRHMWNVAEAGGEVAIVDVSFADDEGPFVLSGSTAAAVYQRAAEKERVYCPSPETDHRYQVRALAPGN